MTDAERQQRRRDRRKAGLVRVEAWVPKQAVDAVRAAIDRAVAEAADGVERTKRALAVPAKPQKGEAE